MFQAQKGRTRASNTFPFFSLTKRTDSDNRCPRVFFLTASLSIPEEQNRKDTVTILPNINNLLTIFLGDWLFELDLFNWLILWSGFCTSSLGNGYLRKFRLKMISVTIQVWRPVSQLELYLTATARSAPCVKDEHRSEVARQGSAAILGPLAAARSHPHGFLCLPPIKVFSLPPSSWVCSFLLNFQSLSFHSWTV